MSEPACCDWRTARPAVLTLIGSVSPAGGNFEEPVTQSTLGTVKCFLGLSYDRAYKRFYPAIDPLISWSRYRDQLESFFNTEVDPHWTAGRFSNATIAARWREHRPDDAGHGRRRHLDRRLRDLSESVVSGHGLFAARRL